MVDWKDLCLCWMGNNIIPTANNSPHLWVPLLIIMPVFDQLLCICNLLLVWIWIVYCCTKITPHYCSIHHLSNLKNLITSWNLAQHILLNWALINYWQWAFHQLLNPIYVPLSSSCQRFLINCLCTLLLVILSVLFMLNSNALAHN